MKRKSQRVEFDWILTEVDGRFESAVCLAVVGAKADEHRLSGRREHILRLRRAAELSERPSTAGSAVAKLHVVVRAPAQATDQSATTTIQLFCRENGGKMFRKTLWPTTGK